MFWRSLEIGEVWSAEVSYVVRIFLRRGPCVFDAFPAVSLAVARVVESAVAVDRLLLTVHAVGVGLRVKVIHLGAGVGLLLLIVGRGAAIAVLLLLLRLAQGAALGSSEGD